MKVSVLGAGDCLGTRLIESFQLGDGPTVTAVARDPAHLARAARFAIDLKVADILDIESLAKSFSGSSAAVHALPLESSELKRSVTTFCRAAAQAGLRRLIYISSADVHGLNPPEGTTEKSPLHLRHAFERVNALVAAERQFESESRAQGLIGTILRPGLIYGPRSEFTAQVATELAQDRAWLQAKGSGICNCVAVDNVVAAISLSLKSKSAGGSTFLVTDEETVTWSGFYQATAHGLGLPLRAIHYLADAVEGAESAAAGSGTRSPFIPAVTLRGDEVSPEMRERQKCVWKFPTAYSRQELGWPNSVSFAEGLRRSLAWWRYAQGDFSTAA